MDFTTINTQTYFPATGDRQTMVATERNEVRAWRVNDRHIELGWRAKPDATSSPKSAGPRHLCTGKSQRARIIRPNRRRTSYRGTYKKNPKVTSIPHDRTERSLARAAYTHSTELATRCWKNDINCPT
jgi:hypothetical protein